MRFVHLRLAAIFAIAAGGAGVLAYQPAPATLTSIEVMIPMRDGTRLFTQIYTPARLRSASAPGSFGGTGSPGAAGSATEPLPIVFQRTPYGVGQNTPAGVATALVDLPANGYVIVLQDIRGRFKSEGEFVMLRQPRDRKDLKAIDESTDTYDTIEWLLKNVPNNNGRVGMVGTSYPAWLAVMGALDPHPALKGIVPMASPADMWIGDDFHHNGAFRLSYGLEYAYMMESSKEITPPTTLIDRYDTYDWYLELGPLSNANRRYFRESLPTWNDFVRHPDYDAFWKRQAFAPWLNRVTVPTLNVAGWWDQEDFFGPIAIYLEQEKYDTARLNFLVVGPWRHGGWNSAEGQKLGNIDFGMPTSLHFREKIQAPFFAYYLKGKGTL
ncbi:MAG: CocE/NonD family hydrolase, partial [Vicinamibacterales bacterium]